MGVTQFRLIIGIYIACRSWSVGYVKNWSKQINAEDNTDAILAEADYIFNNAAEFLGGVEEDMLLAA